MRSELGSVRSLLKSGRFEHDLKEKRDFIITLKKKFFIFLNLNGADIEVNEGHC